jgi:DNA ligase-associated metallophosphoesterase
MTRNDPNPTGIYLHLAGVLLHALPEGALWWPDQATLIVSDLHLEKGSAYAARGQMLPPYDTSATLDVIEALVARLNPARLISLGDSFHDRAAELRLAAPDAARIRTMTAALDWVWVEGNHDPDPPADLGGRTARVLELGGLVFRHEPTGTRGEIAGHFHPCARIAGRGQTVRRKCFITDGNRAIMPSLGAFTGGLNVLDEAIASQFPEGFTVFALGETRVYLVAQKSLAAERAEGRVWRI